MFLVVAAFVLELGAVLAVFTTPEAIFGLLAGAAFPLGLVWLSTDTPTLSDRYTRERPPRRRSAR